MVVVVLSSVVDVVVVDSRRRGGGEGVIVVLVVDGRVVVLVVATTQERVIRPARDWDRGTVDRQLTMTESCAFSTTPLAPLRVAFSVANVMLRPGCDERSRATPSS